MAGKKPIPVYHYDTEENEFRYLGKFESMSEVFKMYSDSKKGELFQDGYNYKKLCDNTYVTKNKIGREGLKKEIRITEDPTIYKRSTDKEIEIFNHLGELVGIVTNVRILEAISNISHSAISSSLHRVDSKATKFNSLKYRYKV